MQLKYEIGDVREPRVDKPLVIVHCCNDCHPNGVMGAGVARALYMKWKEVKDYYHKWDNDYRHSIPVNYYTSGPFRLGEIQTLKVEDGIYVANMVGQRDICAFEGIPPIRYEAIRDCLINLRIWLSSQKRRFNVCAPKFSSHLAGGQWEITESIIKKVFEKTNFEWTIYSLQ